MYRLLFHLHQLLTQGPRGQGLYELWLHPKFEISQFTIPRQKNRKQIQRQKHQKNGCEIKQWNYLRTVILSLRKTNHIWNDYTLQIRRLKKKRMRMTLLILCLCNRCRKSNRCCFYISSLYLTVSPSIWNTSPKFPPLIEYVISLLSPSSLSVAFTWITCIPDVKFPSVRVTAIVGGVNSGALSLMSVTWTVTSLRPCCLKKS